MLLLERVNICLTGFDVDDITVKRTCVEAEISRGRFIDTETDFACVVLTFIVKLDGNFAVNKRNRILSYYRNSFKFLYFNYKTQGRSHL